MTKSSVICLIFRGGWGRGLTVAIYRGQCTRLRLCHVLTIKICRFLGKRLKHKIFIRWQLFGEKFVKAFDPKMLTL